MLDRANWVFGHLLGPRQTTGRKRLASCGQATGGDPLRALEHIFAFLGVGAQRGSAQRHRPPVVLDLLRWHRPRSRAPHGLRDVLHYFDGGYVCRARPGGRRPGPAVPDLAGHPLSDARRPRYHDVVGSGRWCGATCSESARRDNDARPSGTWCCAPCQYFSPWYHPATSATPRGRWPIWRPRRHPGRRAVKHARRSARPSTTGPSMPVATVLDKFWLRH